MNGPSPAAEAAPEHALGAAPAPLRLAHRQARHELAMLCSLILANPASAASLARLVDSEVERPDGALVLGVLLHLADYQEGARFWWEFAAGGGNHLAASCLWFWHQSRASPGTPGSGASRPSRWPNSPNPPGGWPRRTGRWCRAASAPRYSPSASRAWSPDCRHGWPPS
ncbi:hypothetical protein [Kitasatospora cheerisanensis]|uniref:hypothetical protein n=1 Tax=Kitasatospora cheerisanensis TaxID=81942 RepID=UPI0006915DD3|nr:hypothetical protein [Kitasatospora cheerisanensis]